MTTKSNISPNPIWIKEVNGNTVTLRLRKNIAESTNEDNETVYEYDEVEIETAYRDNLEDSIMSKFDTWFSHGLEQENKRQAEKIKNKEIERLVDKKELADELSGLWYEIMMGGM